MLASDPTRRGIGIPGKLRRLAVHMLRCDGFTILQIELFVPRNLI